MPATATKPAPAATATHTGSAFWELTFTELRLFLREKSGLVYGVGLPILLLVIFGSIPYFNKAKGGDFGGVTLLDTYVPILIVFVIGMLSLNVMPPVLAGYREKGILRRLQTTPAGASRVLGAQLLINFAVAVIAVVALLLVARLGYNVKLPKELAGFVLAALLAALATICCGLFASAVSPSSRSANAVGAILFYPMTFFAGLWLPIPAMPETLQHISRATPLGAAVTALQSATQGHWPHPLQWVTMAAWAVGFGLGAAKLFRWE
jgi:ABC-2 type transport system permease protein